MFNVNENECKAAELDVDTVKRLSRRLAGIARDCSKLGITIFGGTKSGSLRYRDNHYKPALLLAYIEGPFDGGDGGDNVEGTFSDGLKRGE